MKKYFIFMFGLVLFLSCNKEENRINITPQVPVVSTIAVIDIDITTAVCGGNMTSDGGSPITQRGVCWSNQYIPTIDFSRTKDDLSADIYKSNIEGLTPNTRYCVRAYATNSIGTGYGNAIYFTTGFSTFTSRFGGTITDIDGNVYHTDTIGTQVWLVENLKTTRFSNGDSIPTSVDGSIWSFTAAYYNYNNDINYVETYGRLYNWHAVNDNRGLAPAGWHVATNNDWTVLINFLEGSNVAGGKLKETGTAHWNSPNTGATNETGFTALPGGSSGNNLKEFTGMRTYGRWWSSTESTISGCALCWYVYYEGSNAISSSIHKQFGLSVRCVKD